MKQEPAFLVCGEALMDVFLPDPRSHAARLDARVGGSPFNVAVGLSRLSQPVAFVGGISRDAMGTELLARLAHEHVDTRWVERSDAPTTQSLVGVDGAGVPTYEFRGEGAADRSYPQERVEQLPAVRAIHVGSFALVVEPIATALRSLVEQRRTQSLIAWDPNVRPTVVPDVSAWRALVTWMLPRIHVLKLSLEDLEYLMPGTAEESFAQRALEAGVSLVVVTRGSAGAAAWTRHSFAAVDAWHVDVMDTVGAGDTFQAAMLTWLAEHQRLAAAGAASLGDGALHDMLRFASSAAAITCTRRGADMPRRTELP